MINPALALDWTKATPIPTDFWARILEDESLRDCDNLHKLVLGCEIIAALDTVEFLAA
jgi:hypothetical protein